MNAILERIVNELEEKGLKDKDLCEFAGIAQSTFATWKQKDREPRAKDISRIAEFLHVSEEYLLKGDKNNARKTKLITPKDERDIAEDLNAIMTKIKDGEDGPLRYNGEEIDEESLQLLEDAISMSLRHLKISNKEKYNPNKNKK